MKINSFLIFALLVTVPATLRAHGPAHAHRAVERAAVDETVGLQQTAIPVEEAEVADRWWGANFTTGWESRHVHYGVNETGTSGAYVNELGVILGDFSATVWNGFGLGNEFLEWDFTAAYNIELGPVFLVPGYNFRYMPGHVEDEHEEEEGHEHGIYGNELFVAVGTTAIPYVIPSANFLWDLNSNPGGFMELRLDGDIPVYGDLVSLQPYALLGLNFGYNTADYSGWNNFQFGAQAAVALTDYLSFFAGVNYSVALEALQQLDQQNIVWANVGLNVAY